MECVFRLTDENKSTLIGVPQPYPAEWFPMSSAEFTPPEDFDPNVMNWISCDGRFISVLAEDGVPFTHGYADVRAPKTVEADSYYMNHRAERPVTVVTADGEVEKRPAGVIGFKHSPEELSTLEEAFEWHDRDLADGWGGAAMERALVRARMIEWDRYLLAVGAVVPTVTLGEANSIQSAEISAEFYMLRNQMGQPRMQIVTASFVIQGNTRTSASSSERTHRASIRIYDEEPSEMTETITTPTTVLKADVTEPEPELESRTLALADGGELTLAASADVLDRVETMLADAVAPAELSEVEELRAEKERLIGLTQELITVDTSPLMTARVETTGELRTVLDAALQEAFASGDETWTWVEDIDLNLSTVRYSIEQNGVTTFWRDSFSFDAERHEAMLAGAPVEIVQDRTWMDKAPEPPAAPTPQVEEPAVA